ncbi:hypothetical protein XSR1_180015 [Xenorhabdus szentirmaii DSM 16338]|uniref:Uncharacterized protein n=1 Tax=Xenorhabdus szentirmaii DSM 16338 TaxID=1427518 RepID=W1IWK0_9GAMM|nr:hypothetical protein XSR1_180015 [Xenorhabdus szentirmaii DSM 16338]
MVKGYCDLFKSLFLLLNYEGKEGWGGNNKRLDIVAMIYHLSYIYNSFEVYYLFYLNEVNVGCKIVFLILNG